MPRYWVLSMVEENYLIAKELGLIGLSQSAKPLIGKIALGDIITFYISKKRMESPSKDPAHKVQQFRGIARVSSEAFESNDIVWPIKRNKLFPYRMKVEFLSDARGDANPLIEKLSFVHNTLYWALPLQKGYEEITPNDFDVIQRAMEKQ